MLNDSEAGSQAQELGDPIHVQYLCGVEHVPIAGVASMRNAYNDFLDFGRTPRKLPAPCGTGGGTAEFTPGTPGIAAASAKTGARAAGPMSLADADDAGLIDLVTMPDQVLAVTSVDKPVELHFTISDGTFTWTPFTDETSSEPLVYGPMNGTVELNTAGGGAPTVTVNGAVVTPQGGSGPPPAPPGSGVSPAGSGLPPTGGGNSPTLVTPAKACAGKKGTALKKCNALQKCKKLKGKKKKRCRKKAKQIGTKK